MDKDQKKWEVAYDGLSLGMLHNSETRRLFRLQELGSDGKPWGVPYHDNDALCMSFCEALNSTQEAAYLHALLKRAVEEGAFNKDEWPDNHPLLKQVYEALISIPSDFKPTHRHAEGGEYQVLGKLKVHIVRVREYFWADAVLYRNEKGEQFVRTKVDFEDRFKEIKNEPSCNCTLYNGGQCYNCLNGAHRICGDGSGRCNKGPG